MISVLYVDDEPDLLTLGKAFLERSSALSVDTSVSADDALKKMKSTHYDAIISDYKMPEMDGITFLKIVREEGNTIPFIIFTGRGREEVIIEALNSGVDFYLQKGGNPRFQFAELKNVILKAVKQKKTEKALLERERKFRAIFDQTFQFIGLMTVDGTLIEANRTALQFSGVNESDVIGKPFWETPWWSYSKELQESLRAAVKRAATGAFVRFEATFTATDGTLRFFDISIKPVLDETGNVILLIPEGRDITDRKRAEDELREQYQELIKSKESLIRSEELYRNVIDTQTELICRFRPDGTLVFLNEAYCRYFGKKCADLIGKKFRPKIPAEDQVRVREHFSRLTRDTPISTIDHRIIMPKGTIRWQRWVDRAIFDQEGVLTEYQTVGRDITDVKLAEEALNNSKSQLNSILKGSPIPQFVIDRDHRVIHWNDALEEYSGINAEEVIGTTQHWRAFYREERPCMADLLVDGAIEKIPEWYKGKYAKSRLIDDAYEATDFFPQMGERGTWLYFTAAPIKDDNGEIVGAVETLEDVTERRFTENALKQALKKLKLLSSITRHDVLNQVTIVRGYAGIAMTDTHDPAVIDLLSKIDSAGSTITRQIEFMRTYEKLGMDEPGWYNIGTLIAKLNPENVSLTCACNDIEIFADPMLENVFFNIIDNAIRHGERVTSIAVHCEVGPDGLTIFVEDDGIGISHDRKERIFEKGYGKNMGLGLFLAREILTITGISISETGVPDRGARFEMHVPKGAYRNPKKQ